MKVGIVPLYSEEELSSIVGVYQLISSQLESLRLIDKDLPFITLVRLIEKEVLENRITPKQYELFTSISMPVKERNT